MTDTPSKLCKDCIYCIPGDKQSWFRTIADYSEARCGRTDLVSGGKDGERCSFERRDWSDGKSCGSAAKFWEQRT